MHLHIELPRAFLGPKRAQCEPWHDKQTRLDGGAEGLKMRRDGTAPYMCTHRLK